MNCPGCGAPATQEALAAGECGYCHAALTPPESQDHKELKKAIAKLADQPKVVNVTRFEVHAPDVGNVAGGVLDSISGRIFGCASGCVSLGMTVGITGLILAFVGYQLWVTTKSMPGISAPAPAPVHAPAPAGKAPRRR
jgi:hypothetical protein